MTYLQTEFGLAKLNEKGYYRIISEKEGNNGKYLHRLIFERFYGEIPKDCVVHHKDNNSLNNCLMNLQLLTHSNHTSLHHTGLKHSEETKKRISRVQKGKQLSDETKAKISENNAKYWLGKKRPTETKVKVSKSNSKTKSRTGFYRVQKTVTKSSKGYSYQYKFYENGKRIRLTNKNLKDLKNKVVSQGLPWFIIDDEKARETLEMEKGEI